MLEKTGDSIPSILSYWLPELISLGIIVALPPLFDAYLIAGLGSTTAYGALGMATNLLHTLTKLSETVPIAAIALIGRNNGAKKYESCGKGLVTTFWTTFFMGITQGALLFFGATTLYQWLGVPSDMATLGAPFLRLRAIALFLAFILSSLTGFMRAIQNTKTPMLITLSGTIIYLCLAPLLVYGNNLFPAYGVYGLAIASIIQYLLMLMGALWYLFYTSACHKYIHAITLQSWSIKEMGHLLYLSIPIMIDKSALSFSYVWLSKMLATMGTEAIATFDIIKNLERSAIMPAAAFAQVITFLVSNRIGANDIQGARTNIIKVLGLTFLIVSSTLIGLSFYANHLINAISPNQTVTLFAVPILKIMSVLVVCDFVQLILAGALRGAGNFKVVMWTRGLCCLFFFLPISYILMQYPFHNPHLQFTLIYGAFYINAALMGLIFALYLLRNKWYHTKL